MTNRNAKFSFRSLAIIAIAALAINATSTNAGLVPISSITGFSGGDSFTAGDFSPLTDGVGITKGNANDPSTWSNDGAAYQQEWYDNHLAGAANGKLGWVAFDFGSSRNDLQSLYLWNGNYQSGQLGAATFNIYYANTPTVALPAPPGPNSTVDYDFASGGWTQLGATESLGAKADDAFDLAAIPSARYLAIEIMSTHGSDLRSGFDEAAITFVPAPAALPVGLVMLGVFAARRRR